jgi:hypothetical protein
MKIEMSEPDGHGQTHPIETPSLIICTLKMFDYEVAALPTESTLYVRQAQARCPELLTRDFKLLFLRCDLFDPKVAAKRYAKYWAKRVEIFGEKAFKPLTFIGDEGMRVHLDSGVGEFIDPSSEGQRRMLYVNGGNLVRKDPEGLLRATWYMCHVLLETEETAKKGLIVLIFPERKVTREEIQRALKDPNFNGKTHVAYMLRDYCLGILPVRLSAWHVCHPAPFLRIVIPLMRMLFAKRLTQRIHVHSGTVENVLEALKKFGIEKGEVPIKLGGFNDTNHFRWLDKRQKLEEKQQLLFASNRICPVSSPTTVMTGSF